MPEPNPPPPASNILTLDEFLALAYAGCLGDRAQGQQAYETARGLQAPGKPPALAALGHAVQRLLEGDRSPKLLERLSDEYRPQVAALLEALSQAAP